MIVIVEEEEESEQPKQIKRKVPTVNEVEHAFELSLKLDKNGACYVVFPDCPPFGSPNGI